MIDIYFERTDSAHPGGGHAKWNRPLSCSHVYPQGRLLVCVLVVEELEMFGEVVTPTATVSDTFSRNLCGAARCMVGVCVCVRVCVHVRPSSPGPLTQSALRACGFVSFSAGSSIPCDLPSWRYKNFHLHTLLLLFHSLLFKISNLFHPLVHLRPPPPLSNCISFHFLQTSACSWHEALSYKRQAVWLLVQTVWHGECLSGWLCQPQSQVEVEQSWIQVDFMVFQCSLNDPSAREHFTLLANFARVALLDCSGW